MGSNHSVDQPDGRSLAICIEWREELFALLDGRNTQILADLVDQDVTDFSVARDCGPAILFRVVPPGMVSALSKKFAAVTTQVAQ